MLGRGKPLVYVFIGPEKTGTTTIFDLLPFAQVPTQKERFLLSRKQDVTAELARIEAQIAEQGIAFIVEPTYFTSVFARQALSRLTDRYNMKVIHTRRDPVERMVSHYLHHKAKGRVSEPEAAVAAYPEIVNASLYEKHAALWKAAVPAFFVINLDGATNLARALGEIGIMPRTCNEEMRSNQRLAPRFAGLASFSSTLWQGLIGLRLNRLVPARLKNSLKNLIYYGGDPVEASEEERACLIHLLSITD